MRLRIAIIAGTFLLSACDSFPLKTREELRNPDSPAPAAQKAAPKAAPAPVVQEESDSQMRQLNGRVEELDNRLSQMTTALQEEKEGRARDNKDNEQKVLALEEALKKQEAQLAALTEQVNKPAPAAVAPTSQNVLLEGDELMTSKKYKEAIVAYQKYRDSYPKGQHFGEATYKIASCFQELGMKDEASAFYQEVVAKYPKSQEAKKAQARLKKLK